MNAASRSQAQILITTATTMLLFQQLVRAASLESGIVCTGIVCTGERRKREKGVDGKW
jgi:hypothetical protein